MLLLELYIIFETPVIGELKFYRFSTLSTYKRLCKLKNVENIFIFPLYKIKIHMYNVDMTNVRLNILDFLYTRKNNCHNLSTIFVIDVSVKNEYLQYFINKGR